MKICGLIFFFCIINSTVAQELFVHSEPASTLPKGVLAARIGYEYYSEPKGRSKYWTALRLMYGAGRKLTIIGTVSASNHHIRVFPGNLIQYFQYHHSSSYPAFPFLFEGVHLYAKYRFFNRDAPQKHFRMALYAEASRILGVHDVAEPNLKGDNSGAGVGMIITRLTKRFALSLTPGVIRPLEYKDPIVRFRSGNSFHLNIGAGYRIRPASYSSYNDLNVNIYAELIHTVYGASQLVIHNERWDLERFKTYDLYTYRTLVGGQYLELRPSLQFIINSNTRIDLSTGIPILYNSYLKYTPALYINYQKNFYSKRKQVGKQQ